MGSSKILAIVLVALSACTTRVEVTSPTTATSRTATTNVELSRLRKHAAQLLTEKLGTERKWVAGELPDQETPPLAWGDGLSMSQLSGVSGFVNNEAPLGGNTASIVITGAPDGHPDDVLYMGVRVGTNDECFYVRDVIARAGASMVVGTVYTVGKCVRPDLATGWQFVDSPLALIH